MRDHHRALIWTMVVVSAADANMTDAEMGKIGELVRYLPIFRDFDSDRIPQIANECTQILGREDGLEDILRRIRDDLPERLRETAYALACDIVAADGSASQEELRLLEMLRHEIKVDRLQAAAIERGARARHMTA